MQETEDVLPRQLKLFPATNIVVADMIGAGIFTTSGLLLMELGSPLIMIGLWVCGGALALCGAHCYGALGAAMPRAGGEYAYLSELFHPSLGFLSGWVSFFAGFSAPLAASSLGFSEYFVSAFPEVGLADNGVLHKKAIAIGVIFTFAIIHLRGMAVGSRVQTFLTVGKVLLIVGMVLAGFLFGQGDVGHFHMHTTAEAPRVGWKAIGLSLMWITFAYTGWNASGYIGSEIQSPRRNLPLSLLIGTGVVVVLYLGLNALFVYAVPPREMQGAIAVGGLAASRLFGLTAERVVSLLIAFALLSAVSALIIIGPRVYYAMARDGYFFKGLATVNSTHRVPANAILLQCVVAAIMAVSGTFDQILTYMGFGLGIFPILAVLGVFKLPPAESNISQFGLHSVAAVIFAFVSVVILGLAYFERPTESSIALITVALGIPFYLIFARANQ